MRVHVLAPGAAPFAVGLEGEPRRVGVHVGERSPIGDRKGDRQRSARDDGDRRRPAGLDPQPAGSSARRRPSLPSGRPACRLDARPAGGSVALSEARLEVDLGVHRAVLRHETPDEQGGREQRPRDLGDHSFGQLQSPVVDLPRGLEHGGLGSVATTDQGSVARRPDAELTGSRRRPPTCPKIGSPSNRGTHIQSMEPSDDTSAAVRVSPMSPWSSIGGSRHREVTDR